MISFQFFFADVLDTAETTEIDYEQQVRAQFWMTVEWNSPQRTMIRTGDPEAAATMQAWRVAGGSTAVESSFPLAIRQNLTSVMEIRMQFWTRFI